MNATAPELTSYRDAWVGYRRRSRIFWLLFLGYVPVVLVVGYVSFWLFGTFTPAFVAAVLYMVAMAVAGNYGGAWRCPRCHRPFFAKWWFYNSFARSCVHCGLPKWAEGDLEQKQKES